MENKEIAQLKVDLSERDREIDKLNEKIEELEETINELEDELAVKNSNTLASKNWGEISEIFYSMTNIREMISFLRRLNREKCICQSTSCEIFPRLSEVDLERIDMNGIENPEVAKKVYNASEFKKWYIKIYLPLLRKITIIFNIAYNIGSPNETREEKVHLEQDRSQKRVVERMERVENKSIHMDFGRDIDLVNEADLLTLTPNQFEGKGNEGVWDLHDRVINSGSKHGEQSKYSIEQIISRLLEEKSQ